MALEFIQNASKELDSLGKKAQSFGQNLQSSVEEAGSAIFEHVEQELAAFEELEERKDAIRQVYAAQKAQGLKEQISETMAAYEEQMSMEEALLSVKSKCAEQGGAAIIEQGLQAIQGMDNLGEKVQEFSENMLSSAEEAGAALLERAAQEFNVFEEFETRKDAVRQAFTDLKDMDLEEQLKKTISAYTEQMSMEEALTNLKAKCSEQGLAMVQKLLAGNKNYANVYKAIQIGEATINSIQGVLKTMASVPFPYNIPMAAAQAAAGAAQVAKIVSAKMYAGGMIPGKDTLVLANETGQEAILNSAAVRAVGGAAGVNALNQNTYNRNSYDNRRASNIVINTTLVSQKTLRDDIIPIMQWHDGRQ